MGTLTCFCGDSAPILEAVPGYVFSSWVLSLRRHICRILLQMIVYSYLA